MLVIVAPGQGSQTPGFLQPWLERHELIGREIEQVLLAAEAAFRARRQAG